MFLELEDPADRNLCTLPTLPVLIDLRELNSTHRSTYKFAEGKLECWRCASNNAILVKYEQWKTGLTLCWTLLKPMLLELSYNLSDQNSSLQRLKWGIVHLCSCITFRDTTRFIKLEFSKFCIFVKKCGNYYAKLWKRENSRKMTYFVFNHFYGTI